VDEPEVEDLVEYQGGVWEIVNTSYDWKTPFDDEVVSYNLQWCIGPRKEKLVYVTDVLQSEVRLLSEMEVLALAATEDHP
jgi:hypothetical protein